MKNCLRFFFLFLVSLFFISNHALAQDTLTIYENEYGSLRIPGKWHFSHTGDEVETLATPYVVSTSLFLVFQQADTLIMVSDKWNLFRNPRNIMRGMDVMEVYADSGFIAQPTGAPFHVICTNGKDQFSYYQRVRDNWCLEFVTLESEGASYGPLKVGESFSEFLERLGWPTSYAGLGCENILILHPTKVRDVFEFKLYYQFLEAETFTAIRLTINDFGIINKVEVGEARDSDYIHGKSVFISYDECYYWPF